MDTDETQSGKLLSVMGLNPDHATDLTARKAAYIMARDKSSVTGFVVTSPDGLIGIVDKAAVRWLTKSEMWWLMHESENLPPSSSPRLSGE